MMSMQVYLNPYELHRVSQNTAIGPKGEKDIIEAKLRFTRFKKRGQSNKPTCVTLRVLYTELKTT